MQEMEKKMGQTSSVLPFLRHMSQIQIDIISLMFPLSIETLNFTATRKNQIPLRVHALEATNWAT